MRLPYFTLALLLASSFALEEFRDRIPNGKASNDPNSGITCAQLGHTPCAPGTPRNQFGIDFKGEGLKWTKKLCQMDSDGDGLTNGEELGDPCCEWSQDNPTPLRTTQLSHPGDASEKGAEAAEKCKSSGTEAPSTTTTTTTDEATSTTTTTTTTETATTTAAPTTETGTTPSPTPSEAGSPSTPSPTPSGSPEDDDDGVCFPAHATVRLESGVVKTMAELEVGDRVQVTGDGYSEIFLFTHKISDIMHEFITIRAGSTDNIEAIVTMTKGHFLYVNGALTTADTVTIGDELELGNGKRTVVFDVTCERHKGLYNPQTTHGDMIVDGVKVSTYTTAVQPQIAHSLLVPLRTLYRLVGWTTSAFEAGAHKILALLP